MSYKWYWMNDSGWTLYDTKKSADLEKGYLAKAKSVTLDKERFVDFSLSWSEIVKNFTNLNDKTMVGIQRRFDDHNRRRAVKREKDSTSFFENLVFAFLPQLQGTTMKAKEKDMLNNVKTYGGKVVTSLSKSVNYLVVTGTTPPDASAETMAAESLKIPIVYGSFITKCILDGSLVDHTSSVVPIKAKKKKDDSDEEEEEEGEEGIKKKKPTKKKVKGEDEEMEGEDEEAPKKAKGKKKKDEEEEEEKPKKKTTKKKDEEEEEEEKPKKKSAKDDKKRKAESDEEEEEEPKKKTKVDKSDAKTNGSAPATTTTTTSSKGKKSITETPVAPPAPPSGSSSNGLLILQPGTDWMGVCTDPTEGTHFPFLLQILKIEKSTFEGFIFWKTLNDAQTKIRGKFAPNGNGGDLDIDIEEYEAVKGEDELELPMNYSGVLSGKTLSGRVGDKASKSTFKADLIKTNPFKLRVPTEYKGNCKSDLPFVLNVTSRTDDELTGTIEWQTTPVTVTKWRGSVSGLSMTVEEHEVVKGDEEFLLRTWKLAVTQDETLAVKTPDHETFTLTL